MIHKEGIKLPDMVMDIEGLGKYLKLAPVTLYKMVKTGKIPCRRIGKSLRFPKEMIDRWLTEEHKGGKIPPLIKNLLSQFAAKVRSRLGERVKEMVLYGSWARDEARIDSDVDIAILIDRKDLTVMKTVSEIAADLSLETDHFISTVVVESETHEKGRREGYPFHLRLEREGISL